MLIDEDGDNTASMRYSPALSNASTTSLASTSSSRVSTSGRYSFGRSTPGEGLTMGVSYAEHLARSRRESTRMERVDLEQRRREELREGYGRLKQALPVSNQKIDKLSLLDKGLSLVSAQVASILTPSS